MEISVAHEFEIDRAELEYAFACEDLERLNDLVHEVNRRDVVEWTDDGSRFRRVSEYHARSRVPEFVGKIFRKDPSQVTQVMEYDRETHRGWYDIESPVLGKRFVYRSEFSIEEPAPGRAIRRSKLTVQVRLPAIGGRVEKLLKHEFEKRESAEYEVCARFLRETWPAIRAQVMESWPSARSFA